MTNSSLSKQSKLLAICRLVRLPNLFSAAADILMGYWIVHTNPPITLSGSLFLLILSSICLYASGVVFNDVFDLEIDRKERPERPLPSGALSVRFAVILGILLMGIGLFAAIMVGYYSFLVSIVLAASILSYDGMLKKSAFAPVLMGFCRLSNILLGMSPAMHQLHQQGPLQDLDLFLMFALANGIYVIGITMFARQEAAKSIRLSLIHAAKVISSGLGLQVYALFFVFATVNSSEENPFALLAWLIFVLIVGRRIVQAIRDPSSQTVQLAVKTAVLGLIGLDAIVVLAFRGPLLALAVLALLLPALLLGRWIPST